jgi:hypothetical protein
VHCIESPANLLGDLITPDNLLRWNVCDVFCVPQDARTHPGLDRGDTRLGHEG